MTIDPKLIDQLLADVEDPREVLAQGGLLKQLTKAFVERVLEAELTEHLGYRKHAPCGAGSGNSRNGSSKKTVLTDTGKVELNVPRDRAGSFEPQLVKKHQRRLEGFDDKVISLYARGMTVREIQGHLLELYGTEVSPDLISRATNAVLEDVRAWQSRVLDPVWPVVYLDGLVVKVRDHGVVSNRTVYLALGINMEGRKEVLGMWMAQSEGAKFWLEVLTDLRNRGVQDILIACCDGLKGLPEAIEASFPNTVVQTCIVHMIRNSLRYVPWKQRKAVAAALRPIYTALNVDEAERALEAFEAAWDATYPMIGRSWRANWERVIPFLAFPLELRRVIYTTNAIEALNRQVRKVIKNRGHFPSDEAAMKLLYLAIDRASRKWSMPVRNWGMALGQLAIHFEGRVAL
mgnify:CR=1 FL=1